MGKKHLARCRLAVCSLCSVRSLFVILFFLFPTFSGFSLFGQAPGESIESDNVMISAAIVGADRSPGKQLGLSLRIDEVEQSEVTSLVSTGKAVPREWLFLDGGKLKNIEVTLWLSPRHFSLKSQRHGKLLPGSWVVVAEPETDSGDKEHYSNLKLFVGDSAPVGELSTVGVLIMSDGELIADISVPLVIGGKLTVGRQSNVGSPFRPVVGSGQMVPDAVLTLVELHNGYIQLTFSYGPFLRAWRVASDLSLKDWPGYIDKLISRSQLKSAAATLRSFIFPSDSNCVSGESDCAAAAALFDEWMLKNKAQLSAPILTLQTLPLGRDETFSPVLIPVGILQLPQEPQEVLLPESVARLSNDQITVESEKPGSLDQLSGEGVLSSIKTDDVLGRERSSSDALQSDPANPGLTVNQPLDSIRDLATEQMLPLVSGIEDAGDDTGYLAYKIIPHMPLYRSRVNIPPTSCVKTWSILLPPSDVSDTIGGLDAAREKMDKLIKSLEKSKQGQVGWQVLQYERSLESLKANVGLSKRTSAWLIVSHFDPETSSLLMPKKGNTKVDSVAAAELNREIAPPGVVVLLACESGISVANSLLKRLLRNGASTIVVTNALLPGPAAGQFATSLMDVLSESGPEGISVEEAFRKALNLLPKESQYVVPRFILAGDTDVRLCPPPIAR